MFPPQLGAGDADSRSLSGGLVVIGNDVTSEAQHAAEGRWWREGEEEAFGRNAMSEAAFSSCSFPSAAAASSAFFLAVVSHSHRPPASGLPLVMSKSQRAAKAVVSCGEKGVEFCFFSRRRKLEEEEKIEFSSDESPFPSLRSARDRELLFLPPIDQQKTRQKKTPKGRRRARVSRQERGVSFSGGDDRPGGRRFCAFFVPAEEKARRGSRSNQPSPPLPFPRRSSPSITLSC